MTKRGIVKIAFAAGMMGLLLVPALVYTQVTGGVLNPRLRQSYPSLSAAVAAAAANDTLLVSGTLSGTNAILDSATDTLPAGLKIVAGRGLRGTLRVTAAECAATTNNSILDVSNRQGPVLIQGLTLVVPNVCTGIYSDGLVSNGAPLTVRGVLIQRTTAAATILGIFLEDEFDGPFLIEQNVIQSTGAAGFGLGIIVLGDGANPIAATVRGNRVGQAGATTYMGIGISQAPTGSAVVVERNIVDGGNQSGSLAGIWVDDSDGVIVRRNTVRNIVATAAAGNGYGIIVEESPNTQVLRNVIANNDVGIWVYDAVGVETADTVVINDNNITSTVTNATGLRFDPDPSATAPLDARNNWWGAASGPRDIDGDSNACPEGPTCAPNGTGLPVDANAGVGIPECGTGAGRVTTCPFRTSPVSGAGA